MEETGTKHTQELMYRDASVSVFAVNVNLHLEARTLSGARDASALEVLRRWKGSGSPSPRWLLKHQVWTFEFPYIRRQTSFSNCRIVLHVLNI
jgi:hypothetical protein